jgi:prolyl oligopeptidase
MDAAVIGARLVVRTIVDAKSELRIFDLAGHAVARVELPGIGAVTALEGEGDDSEAFYTFESFNLPPQVYRLDVSTGRSTVFKQAKASFDSSQYIVRQVFYASKDGTRVPMFIAHRKDLDLGKAHPTLLYGYGGFGISHLPMFRAPWLAWMEMGGIYALANIRGGGEYGRAWHDSGRLFNRQNVYDDFIAAAEYLIAAKLTTVRQLAIQGGSAGGLLVGAVVNQRPDLFAVVLAQVGVMDMLRYDQFTVGPYWVSDYGDPAEEAHFRNLLSYSPYHNIRSGRDYPAILTTTADTDDRVVPGHSFKYAAALQAAQIGPQPHLLRIETRAGHGMGKPLSKAIEEVSDMWAFAGYFTGLTEHAA